MQNEFFFVLYMYEYIAKSIDALNIEHCNTRIQKAIFNPAILHAVDNTLLIKSICLTQSFNAPII